MKKKILLRLLILIGLFTMTGCESVKENTNNNTKVTNKNINSIVLYFSATGTTKKVAEKIASKSNSDIIEIIPKEKYTSEDLNYNSDCRANKEQNNSNARPEIKNTIDISKYELYI